MKYIIISVLFLNCYQKKIPCDPNKFNELNFGNRFSMNVPIKMTEVEVIKRMRMEYDKYSRFSKAYSSSDGSNLIEIDIKDYSLDSNISVDLDEYVDVFYDEWKSSFSRDSTQTLFKGIDILKNQKIGWYVLNGTKKGVKKMYIKIIFFKDRVRHEVFIINSDFSLSKDDIQNCLIRSIVIL